MIFFFFFENKASSSSYGNHNFVTRASNGRNKIGHNTPHSHPSFSLRSLCCSSWVDVVQLSCFFLDSLDAPRVKSQDVFL